MKFRKLILCMFVCVLALHFTNINAFAAEEETTNLVIGDKVEETSTGLEQTENAEQTSGEFEMEDGADEDVVTSEDEEIIEEVITDSESEKIEEETTVEEIEEETTVEEEEEDSEDDTASNKETKKETNKKVVKYTKSQLRLLSALILCEAQSESYTGKLAVGIVVMNRVRSKAFPDTLKGVVYQKYQFSPARNGSLRKALADYDNGKYTSANQKACIKAAKAALSGTTTITVNGKKKDFSKYLFFSGRLRGYTYKIGNHQFK